MISRRSRVYTKQSSPPVMTTPLPWRLVSGRPHRVDRSLLICLICHIETIMETALRRFQGAAVFVQLSGFFNLLLWSARYVYTPCSPCSPCASCAEPQILGVEHLENTKPKRILGEIGATPPRYCTILVPQWLGPRCSSFLAISNTQFYPVNVY